MARKRKAYSASFKAAVALVAVKGDRTISALASHFDVHATLIQLWKKQLLTGAELVFTPGRQIADPNAEAKQAELHEQLDEPRWSWLGWKKSVPLRLRPSGR